ncbi:profilin, required for normal timing of actin polymerization in response to thermal stress [Mortierella hygrophila]|uniref:Profilin n=1 Tax=Mortierella hygrophila TaxID=979708 RepID=A0A9P6F6Q4_9FUNG|nr:profilin, required for normal timing of actin polymerization in response to thermal stress [Mortierella hygrophila]
MSWQAYVDNNLVATGKVAKAAIFGLDGNPWATSPDFSITNEEAKKLIAAFDGVDEIAANGLHLTGTKFVFLRNPDNSIYARHGATGITAVKTGQCVIIGYYADGQQGGDCNQVVENLGNYLVSVGYVQMYHK